MAKKIYLLATICFWTALILSLATLKWQKTRYAFFVCSIFFLILGFIGLISEFYPQISKIWRSSACKIVVGYCGLICTAVSVIFARRSLYSINHLDPDNFLRAVTLLSIIYLPVLWTLALSLLAAVLLVIYQIYMAILSNDFLFTLWTHAHHALRWIYSEDRTNPPQRSRFYVHLGRLAGLMFLFLAPALFLSPFMSHIGLFETRVLIFADYFPEHPQKPTRFISFLKGNMISAAVVNVEGQFSFTIENCQTGK